MAGWRAPLAFPDGMVVRGLAGALVAGGDSRARCERLLGRRWVWVNGVVERYEARFARERPRRRKVERWLREDRGFARACARLGERIRVVSSLADAPAMRPVEAASLWALPELTTVGALAEWLRLRPEELEWFADLKRLGRRDFAHVAAQGPADNMGHPEGGWSPLGHYFYRWVRKRSGTGRLIEEPKARLKSLQKALLHGLLDRVPVHGAAHGFVRGRSIVTFAGPHVGRTVVLRMDLQDFFPGIRAARVAGFFRVAGYPEAVADRLAGICLNAAPEAVLRGVEGARALYGRRHLPQGAPTSAAMANVLCSRLDARLAGLADVAGGTYTRYADDLAFSGAGDFARGARRFADHVGAVALEEGFRVNYRKTRVMRKGERQSLTGLVVNEKLGVGRVEYDSLKALLHNCGRTGAKAQNRDGRGDWRAHLEGRVGFVESVDAARGARLREMIGRVEW